MHAASRTWTPALPRALRAPEVDLEFRMIGVGARVARESQPLVEPERGPSRLPLQPSHTSCPRPRLDVLEERASVTVPSVQRVDVQIIHPCQPLAAAQVRPVIVRPRVPDELVTLRAEYEQMLMRPDNRLKPGVCQSVIL